MKKIINLKNPKQTKPKIHNYNVCITKIKPGMDVDTCNLCTQEAKAKFKASLRHRVSPKLVSAHSKEHFFAKGKKQKQKQSQTKTKNDPLVLTSRRVKELNLKDKLLSIYISEETA